MKKVGYIISIITAVTELLKAVKNLFTKKKNEDNNNKTEGVTE